MKKREAIYQYDMYLSNLYVLKGGNEKEEKKKKENCGNKWRRKDNENKWDGKMKLLHPFF